MFCFTFTVSCCTSCREPNIRLHVTDNNIVDRCLIYQNIQVVGKLHMNWGQDSDWLWNLKGLYWKRQAHASFNSSTARWPSLTRNSPKSHAMWTQNELSFSQHTRLGGLYCIIKTEFIPALSVLSTDYATCLFNSTIVLTWLLRISLFLLFQ